VKDESEIVVKAFDVSEFEAREIEMEMENVLNLRHPLIAAPIGFGVAEGELKIGRLHATGGSLAEVGSAGPVWWTPTAKAEAVVGIALALQFVDDIVLLDGGLKSGNVLFDGGERIQIADFQPMRRDVGFQGRERVCRRGRIFRRLRCSSLRSWPGVLGLRLRRRRTLQRERRTVK
jgi:hypothetical protein